MSKHSIKQRETRVDSSQGVGREIEQTLTVDDNALPSPKELEAYRQIDHKIVDMLVEATQKEQEHRHYMDKERIKILKHSERRISRTNWWGMFFAFLSLATLMGVAAYALYLDKPWFAGVFSFAAVVSIVSVFVDGGKQRK